MDARLQRRVQRYGWDRASEHYERFWSAQLKPAQDLLVRMAELEPGEEVIDIACGTGLVSIPAAEAVGPRGRVLGTDLSDEMVVAARGRAEERGLKHATFERMDAEALKVPDDSFDVALCALGLMYVPDPDRAFEEMLRVVRPGGRVVVAVWGARAKCGWADIFPIVDARVESEVCPLFFQLGTGEALRLGMEGAGLETLEVRRIETTLEYDSDDEALGAAFAGGPVALAYGRFDDQTREEAHAEYLQSIERFRIGAGLSGGVGGSAHEGDGAGGAGEGGGGFRIPGEFVVARGRV